MRARTPSCQGGGGGGGGEGGGRGARIAHATLDPSPPPPPAHPARPARPALAPTPLGARRRRCNNLDPSLKKGSWTSEEDHVILRMHAELGTRWAEIAKCLPGRSDNSVKNRWYSTCSRMLRQQQEQAEAGGGAGGGAGKGAASRQAPPSSASPGCSPSPSPATRRAGGTATADPLATPTNNPSPNRKRKSVVGAGALTTATPPQKVSGKAGHLSCTRTLTSSITGTVPASGDSLV